MKVFICYAKDDFKIANKIYCDLKYNGINSWIDYYDIMPGENWKCIIKKTIRECKYFLAILSSNSINKKGFFQSELKIALDIIEELPLLEKFIIPVRIDDCQPNEEKILAIKWVDLFLNYDEGLNNIINVIKPFAHNSHHIESIPKPPDLYAIPPYIGTHKFLGRKVQIENLNNWAVSPDNSVLLFEAIGGTGKSILTWEWLTKYSNKIKTNWAGRFWYSFYEKGARMVDFCRYALAYITRRSYSEFKEKNTFQLTQLLIPMLQTSPWLFILDGLERVLVSYHRYDASQIKDNMAGSSDIIAHRNLCESINPEDDDLLRRLVSVHPSKILITSRLIPHTLLNQSNQNIPGVLFNKLPGLLPTDAELLIRSCGITGISQNIQQYLKENCDCHPLVIGVLAGLINNYLPNRGNFDEWVSDPIGGDYLNLAKLDLINKHNHILEAAIHALPEKNWQLLSTLALLSDSIEYSTLSALNPHVSTMPEKVPILTKPEKWNTWNNMTETERSIAKKKYNAATQRRYEYEQAMNKHKTEKRTKVKDLIESVKDLEQRGLLQYDSFSKRYDLHPVIRGISAGSLKRKEKNSLGKRVVDYFSQQTQNPYENAKTLDIFDNARHIIKALFHMDKKEEALLFLKQNPSLLKTLNYKFEAHNEILTFIRPFFPSDKEEWPKYMSTSFGFSLANFAAIALRRIDALEDSVDLIKKAIVKSLNQNGIDGGLLPKLINLATTVGELNYLELEDRLLRLYFKNSMIIFNHNSSLSLSLARFRQLSILGKWSEAETFINRNDFSNPTIAHHIVVHLFFRNILTEKELEQAEKLNRTYNSALGIRNLYALRGLW